MNTYLLSFEENSHFFHNFSTSLIKNPQSSFLDISFWISYFSLLLKRVTYFIESSTNFLLQLSVVLIVCHKFLNILIKLICSFSCENSWDFSTLIMLVMIRRQWTVITSSLVALKVMNGFCGWSFWRSFDHLLCSNFILIIKKKYS